MYKIAACAAVLFATHTFALEEIIDYGVRGEQYEITDKNFLQLVQERISESDFSEVKSSAKKNIEKAFIVKNNLPTCQKDNTRNHVPIVTFDKDVLLPTGEIIATKGVKNILEMLPAPLGKYVFFLNVENELERDFISKYSIDDSSSLVLVLNGDMSILRNNKINAQKATKDLIKIFDVKCSPSIAIQQGNQFVIQEYFLEKETNTDEAKK
ncbi:MAG: hypothetical protein PHE67_04910 [Campylobacterales bacterium]|nr:hypothetical protein [Campylobacterales bacterium]